MQIGIIGYGTVGKAMASIFKDNHNLIIYDKDKQMGTLEEAAKADFIFLALPTPTLETDPPKIDLSILDEVIEQITKYTDNTEKIIIIRSTVIPSTTRNYAQKYPNSKFCFSPEFLSENTWMEDALHPKRNVIGADNPLILEKVAQLFLERFPDIPLYKVPSTEAEFTKYMANGLGAMKVIWANLIAAGCRKLGVDYDKVKEMVIIDPMFSQEHLRVTPERGFGGKCFPKDLRAITGFYKELGLDTELMESIWNTNKRIRKD